MPGAVALHEFLSVGRGHRFPRVRLPISLPAFLASLVLPFVRVLTSRCLGSSMDLSSSIPCGTNEKAQTNAHGKLFSRKFPFPKRGSTLELHVVPKERAAVSRSSRSIDPYEV